MNWSFNVRRLSQIAFLAALLISSAACQSRFGRALTFWKSAPPPATAAQSAPGDSVRDAVQKQTEGAYDPRAGGPVQGLESRLKLSPQDAALHVELGRAYENYSIDDLALDQFTRARNLDPASIDALTGLTHLARRHPEQLADLEPVARAFAEKHGDSAAALSLVGSVLDDAGDLAGAEKLYRRALAMEPDAAWLHNNLGFNLLLQARLADAAAELRHAVKLNPASATARNNLGVALARLGDRPAALRVFEETGADRGTAHNNLAVALMEQDRLEESRAELLEALRNKHLFEPALENFKLLLEKDQDRRDWLAAKPFAEPLALPSPREWMRLPQVENP